MTTHFNIPLETKKFCWTFMLETGAPLDLVSEEDKDQFKGLEHGWLGEEYWNYYGAGFSCARAYEAFGIKDRSWSNAQEAFDLLLQKAKDLIRQVGVDWEKTDAPLEITASSFEGTFSPSATVKIHIGILVLRNGQRLAYGSQDTLPDAEQVALIMRVMKTKPEELYFPEPPASPPSAN